MSVVEPKARPGRREERPLWALAAPALTARAGEAGTHRAPWPRLARGCRVRRRRVDIRTGEIEDEVRYATTGLPPPRAGARTLLALLRDRWGSENTRPCVRDVTCGEDRSTGRTAAAPQVCAACRNLAIALVRRLGAANIAAACRTFAGRPRTAVVLVATVGCQVMK